VSLFIMPGEAYRKLGLKEPPRFRLVTRRGYDVIVWQSQVNGVGYALVSEIADAPASCALAGRDPRVGRHAIRSPLVEERQA